MKNTDTRGALCTLRADSGEDGGCGCILDEAFELYKKGLDEVKSANDMVQGMEKAMLVLNSDGQLEEF